MNTSRSRRQEAHSLPHQPSPPHDIHPASPPARIPGLLALATVVSILITLCGCQNRSGPTVTVYASQDQIYAEPILQEFTRQTGIRVRAIYDSEAVKTVALANRLLAERNRPLCDVYWGNEELRTRQLAAAEVFRPTNGWSPIGYRSRRMVINTNQLALTAAPRSLTELTNPIWRGQIALAYPLFGTTATHTLALRQLWGEAAWEDWCRTLVANKPFLVDGNSVAVQFVARGKAVIGLTDSDDIAAAQAAGHPILALPLTSEMLLIPNTVAVVRGAPHPDSAQRLFEFLQERRNVERLITVQALEGFSREEVSVPTLKPAWTGLLRDQEAALGKARIIFLR